MPVNPIVIKWQAPTKNVDGSNIDYELAYELEVNGDVTASFPGRLNPDGLYEQDAEPLFENTTSGQYTVRLRAFRVDQPDLMSDWSNVVIYTFDKRVPEAPLLVE